MMDFSAKEVKKTAAAWMAANEHNRNFHRAHFLSLAEKIALHMEKMQRDTKRRPGTPRGAYPAGYSISAKAHYFGVAIQRLERALQICGGKR